MKKKIICSLMALLLAHSFVACKKNEEKKKQMRVKKLKNQKKALTP